MSTHAGHRRVPLVRIRYRCEAIVTTPERLGSPSVSNPTCVLESAPDTLTALRPRLSANPAHGAGPRLVSAAGYRSHWIPGPKRSSGPDTLTALRPRLSANPAHGAGPRLVSAANDGQARSEQPHLVIPRPSRLLIAAVFEE